MMLILPFPLHVISFLSLFTIGQSAMEQISKHQNAMNPKIMTMTIKLNKTKVHSQWRPLKTINNQSFDAIHEAHRICSFGSGISYGHNARRVAETYFNLSSTLYDFPTYLNELASCHYSNHSHRCILTLREKLDEKSRMWHPPTHASPDCQYHMTFRAVRNIRDKLVYYFDIYQTKCQVLSTVLGGAIFDIHAHNEEQLVHCDYSDLMTNVYEVRCRMSMPCLVLGKSCTKSLKADGNHTRCIRVTAVLSHEHYDSFSESTSRFFGGHEPALVPLKYVIADDATYCTQAHTHHAHAHAHTHTLPSHSTLGNTNCSDEPSSINSTKSIFEIPMGVSWYSGHWFTEAAMSPSLSDAEKRQRHMKVDNQSGHVRIQAWNHFHDRQEQLVNSRTAFTYASVTNRLSNFSLLATKMPVLRFTSLAITPPHELANKFLYHATVLHHGNHSNSNSTKWESAAHVNEFNKVKLLHSPWEFVFVGSSHMRYNFDAVTEHLLGHSKDTCNRKPGSQTIGKFTYDDSLLATDHALSLERFCTKPMKSSATKRRMVFLQTGHWDLSYYGLRFVMQSVNLGFGGVRLLRILERIFSGNMSCPSIHHLVWITAVPYPMCYNNWDCEKDRTSRYNANLEALNEFYVSELLKLYSSFPGAKNSIKLSFIDAFSIVAPRLLFNEDNEVTCRNHYICTVSPYTLPGRVVKDSLRNRSNHSREEKIVFTPGGAAVVQAILSAVMHVSWQKY